jgi:hypothetical protein
VVRVKDDPDNLDCERLAYSADVVLHLYFAESGLYSPRWTLNYLPRVNASGIVYVTGRADYLNGETRYFGIDAREGKSWAIPADEKFFYPDFEPVLARMDHVRSGFSISSGIDELSKRMSEQIHAALK